MSTAVATSGTPLTITPRVHATDGWDAERALEELYSAHYASLVRISMLLVRDQMTAEEVVQDVFVAMHARWGRLREREKALAYLRRSVVNRSRSVLRHRSVVTRHLLKHGPAEVARVSDSPAVDVEQRNLVLDALQQIPRRQREVVVLRYYADLSEAESAAILQISQGAVKSHASRGLAALRRLMEEE